MESEGKNAAERNAEFRMMLERKLEALKANIRPLVTEANEFQARLIEVKKRGEVLATQAFGVLLALGMSEPEAMKEVASWRTSAG